jgi:Fe2+ transport system protein FeoA
MMRLSAVRTQLPVQILRLPDGDMRTQFIRIGLMEGALITCIERLPGGTVVLRHHRQEIALSADLADAIWVGF